MNRSAILIALSLGALPLSLGATLGCSSAPPETESAAEDVAETPQAKEVRLNIPEYRDLAMIDGDPEVSEMETDGDVASFRVGNLDVIHMPTPANEVVAVRLYLRGGSANLDKNTAGIDWLSLAVATNGGTESTPKNEFNARLDAMGSHVSFISDRDFSGYAMRSIGDYFDETWDLFEEAIFEPAMADSEVELRRDRQLSRIAQIVDNPDQLVNEVTRDLTFADHPYRHRQLGTEDSVANFSADHLRAWQRHMLAPERMVLVVVGNVERDHLISRIEEGLGRLAATDTAVPETPPISHDAPALRVEEADLPTNYILGYYDAPTMGDDDYPALVLATQHLRDRLFEEVRTKRNLTYAVSSGVGSRLANAGYLYVTAVDPAATMPVIFNEVTRLQEETIDAATLEKVRNVYLTRHYMDLETNASVAGQLGRAAIVGGDWRLNNQFLDQVLAVEPADIQRVAQQYLANYQFGVVGNPDDVPPELFGVSTDDVDRTDEFDTPEQAPEEQAPSAEPAASAQDAE